MKLVITVLLFPDSCLQVHVVLLAMELCAKNHVLVYILYIRISEFDQDYI